MKIPTFVAFASRVLRVPLTRAQRVLASVAFDGVEPGSLAGEDRAVAEELFGPVDTFPPEARSILVAVLGARAGKSYVFVALYSLWRALFADLSTLAPGERGVALIVAPDLRLGRQALSYAAGAIDSMPEGFRPGVDSRSSDSIILTRFDGRKVAIEVLPASRGGSALRGRSLVSACLDECAFFRDENAIVNDVDLFRAVAPRVLPGGLVILASTPWLEQGLLYEKFQKNHGTPIDAMAAHGPTLLMLPSDRNKEAVAREEESDPDNAAREFGAQFVLGGSALFFGPDVMTTATVDDEPATHLPPGCRATLGGDIGLVKDSSAFVAVHRYPHGTFLVADIEEMRPKKSEPLKLSGVVERAAEVAKRHATGRVWVDHHVLQPAREHLPPGLLFEPVPGGQTAKAERFVAVRQAMKEDQLSIPRRFVRLRAQLAEVYSKPLPGGGVQIFQRRKDGAHGDAASAFVNAAWAALRQGPVYIPRQREREPRDWEGFFSDESARNMKGF